MLVADLISVLETSAPSYLAQEWDNSGLQVGDPAADVRKILVGLDLTHDVLSEAVAGEFDTIITHHPVLFSGISSLVESHPKERVLRALVRGGVSVVSCHTNLDAAEGGIAEIVGEALGLRDVTPLQPADSGWTKLVGFIPQQAVERVGKAVFAVGAGGIGRYSECAFETTGTGWFTPMTGSRPAVGTAGTPERTAEVRWETVFPKERAAEVVRAFARAHPYEEPAFDLYPIEDVLPGVGIGRVGQLESEVTIEQLAAWAAEVFEIEGVRYCGPRGRLVREVCVVPGSGRGCLSAAVGRCDALISGDFTYHDSEVASGSGLGLIDVPHGGLEWWAFKRWGASLAGILRSVDVEVVLSQEWRDPWRWARA